MLRSPRLDDRDFQSLVDEAKRLVQQRCPTWTDHNVSDPGVTLIEAFATMVDQLIYRLNRVPDHNYVKFLELIGVELRPPVAAHGSVTFWLSAPQPQPVVVRSETQVATPRTDVVEPVTFSTTGELVILPCTFAHVATQFAGSPPLEVTGNLGHGGFGCFNASPVPDDALLLGLSDAVPRCAVLLRLDCVTSGRGVDPRRPPVVWEAWTEGGWAPCEVGSDGTGGLNRPGDVILHVPSGHQASVIARERGGWLRCRLVEPEADQPTYTASPTVLGIEAFTIGGTVGMTHAETVRQELIGRSDGTPGQHFGLLRHPVTSGLGETSLVVITADGEQRWHQVPHFAAAGPDDRVFRIDAYAGEVQFGPAVRDAGGALRYYGAVPPVGEVRVESYRTGGGRAGNVATGQVRVLKTSVPYVARVENRSPSVGGAEAESLADAKDRGPLLLRSRDRAVTAADFEELAREASAEVARVHCVPEPPAGVRMLVVPHVRGDEIGRIRRVDLDPRLEVLEQIAGSLEQRRLVGTRVLVQPPDYVWLTAVVSVHSRPRFDPGELRAEVLTELYRLFDPLIGGPAGHGWPFGRSIQSHEVHAALARIPGVDMSREIRVALYPAESDSGRRSAAVERLDLPETGLVYSYEHQVRVTR